MNPPTNWVADMALVTPVALRSEAASILAGVTRRPEDDTPLTFSLPLYPLGAPQVEGPTHYLCHIRARDQTLALMPSLSLLVPGSRWCVTRHDDPQEPTSDLLLWLSSLGASTG